LDRLLKDATARRINMIAAWSVDRLGRSLQLAMRNKNNAIPRTGQPTRSYETFSPGTAVSGTGPNLATLRNGISYLAVV